MRRMTGFATILAALALPAAAQQAGIALPVEGRVYLWDMHAEPPEQLTDALPKTAQAGICYLQQENKLIAEETQTCLGYYVLPEDPADAPVITVTGQLTFNDRSPDLAYRGLQLNDVEGVENCGERENCDILYIAGFKDAELARQAMDAAREGRTVTLVARQVWNMESLDLVVDGID